MIATDIAARGLDISQISHVFNYDMPQTPETYLHRMGRTGRAGEVGETISFCSNEELSLLKDVQKHIGMNIPVVKSPINYISIDKVEKAPLDTSFNKTKNEPIKKPKTKPHTKHQLYTASSNNQTNRSNPSFDKQKTKTSKHNRSANYYNNRKTSK